MSSQMERMKTRGNETGTKSYVLKTRKKIRQMSSIYIDNTPKKKEQYVRNIQQ